MSDRYECCGDSDCSCTRCTPMRVTPEKKAEIRHGLLFQVLKRSLLWTCAFAFVTAVVWFVDGRQEPLIWLNGESIPGLKNWIWVIFPYFLGLAFEIWMTNLAYRHTSK